MNIAAFLLLSSFAIIVFGRHEDTHGHAIHRRAVYSEPISEAPGLSRLRSRADADRGEHACGPEQECDNGACCGKNNVCGYGPVYCGDGCQSNCDAKAECGEYAETTGANVL